MKQILFSFFITVLLLHTGRVYAQFPYSFSVSNEAYQPLTDGEMMNNVVWLNSDNLPVALPFNFAIDTVHCNHPYIEGGSTFVTDVGEGVISAFFLTDANMVDKGFLGSDLYSLSPIRSKVTGDPGKRIFKLEIANAGFFSEIIYHTQRDSANMQIWFYEGSNIVELRYGPSHITHGYNYFPNKGLPDIGYVKDVDYSLNGIYYMLAGDPGNPHIDSIESVNGVFVADPVGLDHFPANGTVYRFTPSALNINRSIRHQSLKLETRIYPTWCHDEVNIDYFTDKPSTNANFEIYAPEGDHLHINGALQNGTTHINISTLPPGIYILKLNMEDGIKTAKFEKW